MRKMWEHVLSVDVSFYLSQKVDFLGIGIKESLQYLRMQAQHFAND